MECTCVHGVVGALQINVMMNKFAVVLLSMVTEEQSVRAAAAEIIAADFYAAPTESLLPKKFGSSCRQQGSAPIVC